MCVSSEHSNCEQYIYPRKHSPISSAQNSPGIHCRRPHTICCADQIFVEARFACPSSAENIKHTSRSFCIVYIIRTIAIRVKPVVANSKSTASKNDPWNIYVWSRHVGSNFTQKTPTRDIYCASPYWVALQLYRVFSVFRFCKIARAQSVRCSSVCTRLSLSLTACVCMCSRQTWSLSFNQHFLLIGSTYIFARPGNVVVVVAKCIRRMHILWRWMITSFVDCSKCGVYCRTCAECFVYKVNSFTREYIYLFY